MPSETYEIIAQGARYWFLFLMALIVWRSWRWYRSDGKARRKYLRKMPDAGYVGELVVLKGEGTLKAGMAMNVPFEGTLGFLRTNDICVPLKGVAGKHVWFGYDERKGLRIEPYHGRSTAVDGDVFKDRRDPRYMADGSILSVGTAEMRLHLFAGYETEAVPRARLEYATKPEAYSETPAIEPGDGADAPEDPNEPEASALAAWQFEAPPPAMPQGMDISRGMVYLPGLPPMTLEQYAQWQASISLRQMPYQAPYSPWPAPEDIRADDCESAEYAETLAAPGAEFAPPARLSDTRRTAILDANGLDPDMPPEPDFSDDSEELDEAYNDEPDVSGWEEYDEFADEAIGGPSPYAFGTDPTFAPPAAGKRRTAALDADEDEPKFYPPVADEDEPKFYPPVADEDEPKFFPPVADEDEPKFYPPVADEDEPEFFPPVTDDVKPKPSASLADDRPIIFPPAADDKAETTPFGKPIGAAYAPGNVIYTPNDAPAASGDEDMTDAASVPLATPPADPGEAEKRVVWQRARLDAGGNPHESGWGL